MTLSFTAKKREGKPDVLRAEGNLPGVLYGPEIEPVSLEVDRVAFEKMYAEAGESSLIDFTIEGSKDEPTKVLVQEVVYDSIKQIPVHFDLRQIKMGVEMAATIAINFIGESQAMKEGGTLNAAMSSLNVKCLPKDLISEIEVDLTALETFDDAIHVKDIKFPEGIVVTDDENGLVAKVAAPLTEEQLKAMDEAEAPSVEDVEVEGEKKEEGEAGEEEKKEEKPAEEKKD
ncbi:MAG: 50S ribosomal protein L25 [Candidatus Magasanikbacteria bacterium]|jgi:large subunit ribosomal protein L25|nr:50S ribosomal protein L25 [Candidatus Parcubacteria bacterium]MBT4120484.1 50S ribosomal protein L25 [Candidatus Magasanikbacteria bacterium]MBT4315142.1 50S ribosomal protein L25 [Candidatus Magasanikbacteria bacterium]MBT4547402.1 50S ribosomal protein L25 [Candidatus Magasanikbacteria bacterium]MBT6819483.1 50S ribosomal protein L25 [Candidatus Magasanikbacteria bacterium]